MDVKIDRRICAHGHVIKRIGYGADGKTYCANCGVERPPFSYMDLMSPPAPSPVPEERK